MPTAYLDAVMMMHVLDVSEAVAAERPLHTPSRLHFVRHARQLDALWKMHTDLAGRFCSLTTTVADRSEADSQS